MRSDRAGAGGCPGRASGRPCCGSCAARTWRRSRARSGATAAALAAWRDVFLAGGEAALATRPADGETLASERLKARLGEMLLRQGDAAPAGAAGGEDSRPGGRPPFGPKEAEAMSRTTSPSGGKPYGLARAC